MHNCNVVSFWTLDEAAAPYIDSVGSNDGTVAAVGDGPDLTAAGQVNGAQVFTAANTDGIDVLDGTDDFDWPVGQSFSIEFWMKGTPSGTTQVLVGRESAGSIPQWLIGIQATTGLARVCLVDSDGKVVSVVSDVDITDGGWHHIVCVRDAGNFVHLYVDGTESRVWHNKIISQGIS